MPLEPEDLEAASEIVRWSPSAWAGLIAVMATLYLLARVGTWLATWAASWPLRRYRGDLWSERARRAWPSRRVGGLAVVVLGLPAGLVFVGSPAGSTVLPRPALMIAASTLATIGVMQSTLARERRLNPAFALTPSATRTAWISRLLILGPVLLVVLAAIYALPDRLDGAAVAVLVAMALGLAAYLTWGWTALMRRLGVIRPAGERLRRVAERAGVLAGLGPRAVEQVALPMANALAFTLERKLGVTDAALAVLDDDQLSAVCATSWRTSESRAASPGRAQPGASSWAPTRP